MSFNSIGQMTGNHKPWDHVGNIVPDVEHSEGERPAVEFQPAKWLPVQFWDKHYENWAVIMPGKLVSLDRDGYVIPAEYAMGTTTTVTYTAADVAAGTVDIATGAAVTAAKIVTLSQLSGVKEAGWTAANAGDTKTSGFMGRFGVAWSVAATAIGVAPYVMLQHPGGDGSNPVNFKYHNYNMQHQVAVLCDYVIRLPLVPGQVATEALTASWAASAITFGTANGWRNITYIRSTARYAAGGTFPCAATLPIAAFPLDNLPVARNTSRTTLVCSDTTLLVNEMSSPSAIRAAGDYFVDYEVGVLFTYSWGGTSMPVTSGQTLTYYHYGTAPAVLSRFGCVLATTTELLPGMLLTSAAGSNWTYLNPASSTPVNTFGQVLGFVTEPQDLLQYVRTAYASLGTDSSGSMANQVAGSASLNLGQMDQMPGSATGGASAAVHYTGAADRLVIINLIGR